MVKMKQKYDEKSCGVVVFKKEEELKFLLLLYPGGHWDFPKGHVEDTDATEQETANRELIEETGISDLVFIDNFRHEISYKYNKFGTPSHKLVVFFLGKTELKDVKLSHEHHDSLWLNYEEALQKLTFENARSLLRKGYELIKDKKL